MEFSCPSCGAPCTIESDDASQGVQLVRCGRCSASMRLRIADDQPPQPPPAEQDAADASGGEQTEWHLGVDGEQAGPFDLAELKERIQHCSQHAEVLVWREGLDDWLEPGALPETAPQEADESLDLESDELEVADFLESQLPRRAQAGAAAAPAEPGELEEYMVDAVPRSEAVLELPSAEPPSAPPPPPALSRMPAPPLLAPRPPTPAPAKPPGAPRLARLAVLLLGLTMLIAGGALALLLQDEEPGPEPPEAQNRELPPRPAVVQAQPRESIAPAAVKPTPRRRLRVAVVKAPPTTAPGLPAAALPQPKPAEEPLPATTEGKHRRLVELRLQLRTLAKKRGELRRYVKQNKDKVPWSEMSFKVDELRELRIQMRKIGRRQSRLLEALPEGPPLH